MVQGGRVDAPPYYRRWRVIKVIDLDDLAEICAALTKRGIRFTAERRGDGYWHIELTGY